MEFNRPKIELTLSPIDRLLDALAWAGVIFVWVYTIFCYSKLPLAIPTHYTLHGHINGYGSRDSIWAPPIILTVLIAGLATLNKYPHIFNYSASLTPQNAQKQYLLATRLIRYLQCILVALFSFITYQLSNGIGNKKVLPNSWPVVVLVVLINILTAIYIYRSNKKPAAN